MRSLSLDSALVRILIDDRSPRESKGAGFLVTPQHVITCAHVVNDALGLPQRAVEQPDLPLLFDFPLLAGQPFVQAKILRWFPVQEDSAIGELEDIAVLELLPDSPLPAGAQPAPLVVPDEKEHVFFAWKVRMFGFPSFAPDGTWANGVLQGLTGKGWAEIHHADSGSVAPGFSGTAVWSVRENAVCGMTVSSLSSAASYMIPAAALIQAFPEMDRFSRPANPYRGMEAFREKDARFYFGREADADTLKEKIDTQPFTAVIGASGSGKSSLVFAGLLPMLRQSGDWLICACRPKQQPFHELAACLIPMLYEDELERIKKSRLCAADLRSGDMLLSDLLRRIADRNDCRRLLLLVDQFEELYTLNTDRAAARAFVSLLLEAKQAEGFRAVITLRADFLEAALGDAGFAETLNACPPLLLSPIDSHGLRQAVEQPAKLLGIRFEAGLVDLIVTDVGNEPGSLPLLEFCLTQLWEQQTFRQISHAAYKDSGGVQQALARHAEAVYAGFAATEQESVQLIFLKLVRPGQGTEDTRQVAALADFQEEQRGLIKQLADQRLLVTSGDKAGQQVEVVHEALIRHWQTLRKWVDAEREFLVWQEKLRVLLRQWQESGHDEGALLRGLPLDEALQWRGSHAGYLGEEELGFVRESEEARKKQRRRKGIAAAAGMLLAAVVMAVFFVLWQDAERQKIVADQERRHAVEQRGIAEQQTLASNYNLAKAFEEKALTALKTANGQGDVEYKKAVLFASATLAQKIPETATAMESPYIGSLFSLVVFHSGLAELAVLRGHENSVSSAAFSPDGEKIVSVSDDHTVRIWDAASGKQVALLTGHEYPVTSAAFSPDGKKIVSASEDNTVRIWDVDSSKELAVLKGISYMSGFSPDGKKIVSASWDTVRIWDVDSGKELAVLKGHESSVNSVAFSPDGKKIVLAPEDNTVRIWDVDSSKELAVLKGHESSVNSVAFSPDNSKIVSASDDNTVRIWDAASGQQVALLTGHENSVRSAAFSPDGKKIVSASWDRTVRIWDVDSGKELAVLKDISYMSGFSPDGKKIVSASWDTVRIWDVDSGKELAVLKGHESSVNSVAFSPDGKKIVSASEDNTVRIWDADSGKEPLILKGQEKTVRSMAFSSDGKKIVSASEDYKDYTIRIWDADSGKELSILKGHVKTVRRSRVRRSRRRISLPPDDKENVSASDEDKDNTVRVWNVTSDKEPAFLKKNEESVLSPAFSPNDKQNVLASEDKGYEEPARILSVAFSLDSKKIVLALEGNTLQIWDADSGKELANLKEHEKTAPSIDFDSGYKKISRVEFGETSSRIWDVNNKELAILKGNEKTLSRIAFSPDDKKIVSTSEDNTVRIWDAASGKELAVLKGIAYMAGFSPDGKKIVSPFSDHVRILDLKCYQLFLQNYAKPTPLYRTFIQAVKFLWQLDVQGLEIVHKERSPADMERFGSLLAPPPPGQSKFDQVLEWAEKQQGGSGQQAD
ncbi:hypothetical protein GCAAIG_14100 [Candidatus Electronema halotolerans]